MSEVEKYISIEPEDMKVTRYIDDVEFIISTPSERMIKEVPAHSNVTYEHIYVSIS